MIEVTLCALTLNEEDLIEKCLSHHANYVNYIVIVDGGSSDKTVDIAQEYTNRIYVNHERKDFAFLRNLAQA